MRQGKNRNADHRSQPRPGGRTARVRANVLQSAYRLLAQNGLSNLTIADVAADSGVHETTIYRRWKNPIALAGEACLAAMAEAIPPPNAGRLRGDLIELTERIINVLE